MIELIKTGLNTTIQDNGRLNTKHLGIPQSGFMDVASAQLANLLVNNNPNAPLIEMCLVGCAFKTLKPLSIAVTGADMQFKINSTPKNTNTCYALAKNDVVSFTSTINGVYTYIAFSGEIKTVSDFKSKSMYLKASLGHQAFKKGDVIEIENSKQFKTNAKIKKSEYKSTIELECLPGPEFKLFSKNSISSFLNNTYTISNDSNRMGIRLKGNMIPLPVPNEIISSGIVKGTVQITKAGLPIVMMADAPTTGGYLRIVNLTTKACNQLSQISINNKVKFKLKKSI